ncbi:uncharacterized protein CTHT_0056270 [Thermochaetoides thermophila DSM 1495]|uniref:Ecp2 effector protein-like domain-containing protein n=1 Tax=Chaetomium thermophilum (strain DSM 1495 / CBS 144.50 / IMI 039719) TaxID=759272 RepID=G0SC81_CHATD|nr:hypothetical protein CTHT_0056270 [Thermochaetoides thermophila DSM 1495]EGS19007.1 hypothetical protein CTHT_0056270 [Thermochaetoides thermophila DSM 1495]
MKLPLFQIGLWAFYPLFTSTLGMSIPVSDKSLPARENSVQGHADHVIRDDSAAWNVTEWGPTRRDALSPRAVNHCGASTFVDQTSNASPLVDHCLQIIRNIQGDPTTSWRTSTGRHRTIASHATCRFGVESTGSGSNIWFDVGGEDVQDLIRDSVRKFARNGKVGAKGVMSCYANNGRQQVLWGIF